MIWIKKNLNLFIKVLSKKFALTLEIKYGISIVMDKPPLQTKKNNNKLRLV